MEGKLVGMPRIDAYCRHHGAVRQDGGERCTAIWVRRGKVECGVKLRGIRLVVEPTDEEADELVRYWSEARAEEGEVLG